MVRVLSPAAGRCRACLRWWSAPACAQIAVHGLAAVLPAFAREMNLARLAFRHYRRERDRGQWVQVCPVQHLRNAPCWLTRFTVARLGRAQIGFSEVSAPAH